jgi:hypothetical protein
LALAGPTVNYTDIISGPGTGGEDNKGVYLSLFGTGFGNTRGTSKVLINGTEVGAYKYWSDKRISVQPGPSVTSGAIQVVVGTETSDEDHTFTVRPGDIYFLSYSGSDSGGEIGNIDKPFRHVLAVWDRSDFGPGDFMVLLPVDPGWGYHTEDHDYGRSLLTVDKSGTPGNPITVYGYPSADGAWPVIDLSAGAASEAFRSPGGWGVHVGSHFVAANFYLDKGGPGSCETGGGTMTFGSQEYRASYMRVANIEVVGGGYNTGGYSSVMHYNRTWDSKFLGIRIHDTCPNAVQNKYHLLYFGQYGHGNNEVAWCELYNNGNGGSALQLYSDDPVENLGAFDIHHNVFYNLTREAIIVSRHVDGPVNIYNNLIYNTGTRAGQSGGMTLGAENAQSTISVYNNTFANVGSNVILYMGDWGGVGLAWTFRNNIFHVRTSSTDYWAYWGGSAGIEDALHWDHNLFFNSNQSPPPFSDPATRVVADPQFVNVGAGDFRLGSNSPAIDAGANLALVTEDLDRNPRPMDGNDDGTATHDIGTYESDGEQGSGEPEIPPPPPLPTVE